MNTPTRHTTADRVVVAVLIFGLGFCLAEVSNRAQLRSMDAQVVSALASVETAHAQIDQLEGCTLRADRPIATAQFERLDHE